MSEAYLLIGGNLGDRAEHLKAAIQGIIQNCGAVLNSSSVYETAAWGVAAQPDFLNQVLRIETSLSPHELLKRILMIEQSIGRIRREKNGARNIDIDILYFDNLVIDEEGLKIPHPRIAQRRFVLKPLSEIAGGWKDPVLGKTVNSMLQECTDPLTAKIFE